MAFITTPDNILRSVDIVFQVMAKAGYRYDGLFPAVAERQNGQLLMDAPLPPPIPGQRNSDRSPRGCNLSHDIPLLAALDGLAHALNRPRYTAQREQYLRTFATVCAPASPTGLLPWGEHAYWNLHLGMIGNSYLLQYLEQPLDASLPTHHQLSILPLRDWRVIHEANPRVLPRFVDGLDWHWMDEQRTQFNRHAPITQFIRAHQIKRAERITGKPAGRNTGSDFPGAAGVFIHDYAAAIALTDGPDPAWEAAMMRFCDSWWDRRLRSGLCPKSGSTDPTAWQGPAVGQTRSLAGALFAAGDALAEARPDLSELLHERAKAYSHAVLDCEQPRVDEGRLLDAINPDGTPFKFSEPWAGNRGNPATARVALQTLHLADRAGDSRGLDMVSRAASVYRESFCPRDVLVRAGDPGAVIALLGELYRQTGERTWLDAAMQHATEALELYFDAPLPRMSLGRSHYESQQGSGVLVHALARLVLIAEGIACAGGLAEPMA